MSYMLDTTMSNEPRSTLSQIGRAMYSIPTASAISAITGIQNTAISLGNALGGDFQQVDPIQRTEDLVGSDIADFYASNEGLVDGIGFVASSIVPGTLAVKGLRAGQRALGNAAAREGAGLMTTTSSKILGRNNPTKKLVTAIRNGENVATNMSNATWRILGENTKQNVLETIAFDSAALLTNNQNSFMNPEDLGYFGAIGANMDTVLLTSAMFGGVFGVGGTLIDRFKIGQAQKAFDQELKTNAQLYSEMLENEVPGSNIYLATERLRVARDNAARLAENANAVEVNTRINSAISNAEAELYAEVQKLFPDFNLKTIQREVESGVAENSTDRYVALKIMEAIKNPEIDLPAILSLVGGLKRIRTANSKDGGLLEDSTKIMRNILDESLQPFTGQAYDDALAAGMEETVLHKAFVAANKRRDGENYGVEYTPTTPYSFRQMIGRVYEDVTNFPDKVDLNAAASIMAYGSQPKIFEMLETTKVGNKIKKELDKLFAAKNKADGYPAGVYGVPTDRELLTEGLKLYRSGLGTKTPALDEIFGITEVGIRYSDPEAYINLKTMEMTSTASGLRAADIGKLKFNRSKTYLDYGSQLRPKRVSSMATHTIASFLKGESDQMDITATWALANAGKLNFKDLSNLDYSQLPALQRLWREAADATNEDWLPSLNLSIKNNKGETSKIESFAQLTDHLKRAKKAALVDILKDNKATRRLTLDDIVELLDVTEEFVASSGALRSNTVETFVRNADYTDIKYVKGVYENDMDELGQIIRLSKAEVVRRHKVRREHMNSVTMSYLGGVSAMLPPNAVAREYRYSPTDSITYASRGTNLIQSYVPDSIGATVFQGIGKVFEEMKNTHVNRIGTAFAGIKEEIKRDTRMISELTVINNKLAQGDYGVFHLDQETIDLFGEVFEQFGDISKPGDYLLPAKAIKILREGAQTNDIAKEMTEAFNWYEDSVMGMFRIQSPKVVEFLNKLSRENQVYATNHNKLNTITGDGNGYNPYTIPPVIPPLKEVPELAKVEFTGERKFGTGVGYIGARTPQELNDKIRVLKANRDDIEVTPISEIEAREDIIGGYDANLAISDSAVNPDMRKLGVRWDVLPEASPQLVDDFISASLRRRITLDRRYLYQHYVEDFEALRIEDAVVNPQSKAFKNSERGAENSSQRKAMNTALGISDPKEYYWYKSTQQKTGEAINRFAAEIGGAFDKVVTAYNGARKRDLESAWEELTDLSDYYNLPQVYQSSDDYVKSTSKTTRDVAETWTRRLNMIAYTLSLRLDNIQGIMNALSTPITTMPVIRNIRQMVNSDSFDNIFRELGGVQVPDSEINFMSDAKIYMNTIKDFFDRDLIKSYREKGLISHKAETYLELVDETAMQMAEPNVNVTGVKALADKFMKAATFMADHSEEFSRFMGVRAAERIVDKAIEGADEAAAAILTANKYSIMQSAGNQVAGNYIASQRPALFQGWFGSTLGLFQTYQFNLMQMLTRNVASGNKKAAMMMVGFQSGLFGVQSMPGFKLINDHIATQEGNADHTDIYAATGNAFGKNAGDTILYGLASATTLPFGTGVNFYSRGDLTPRTPILIPTSLAEIPVVSYATKITSNMAQTMRNFANGEDFSTVLWQSLAHNGINRPLQGFGQLMMGQRTTATGTTLLDFEELDNRALHGMVKLLGTTTTDESVKMDAFYRAKKYQSLRQQELNNLGQAIKSDIRGGNPIDIRGVLSKYVEHGGDGANFDRWYQYQVKSVTESQYSQMRNDLSSPEGRYLQSIAD